MKLTVFGPTGPTGEQIVRRALAAGHEVTAVARRPDAVASAGPRLRVVVGDVLDPASVRGGVAGSDAVLSARVTNWAYKRGSNPARLCGRDPYGAGPRSLRL